MYSEISHQSGILFILLYDEDKLKRDDFLGQAIVTLDNLPSNANFDLWLPLFPRKEGEAVRGSLHVKISYNYSKDVSDTSNPIFGAPIEDLVSRPDACVDGVPKFIISALEYIQINALDEEGLFRISGSLETIKTMRNEIDKGIEMDFTKSATSPHNVTGLVKLFLREMPEPLLTFELYEEFLDVVGIENQLQKLEKLSSVIGLLPSAAKSILKLLLPFFAQVLQHTKQNKMSLQNLSIVFGPSFLRPKEETFQSMFDAVRINEVTSLLIANGDQFLMNCLL